MGRDSEGDRPDGKVVAVIRAVLEVDDSERQAAIHRLCGGDESLERDVAACLSPVEEDFLEEPVLRLFVADGLDEPADALAGTRIGEYELIECVGLGGMGRVYRARKARLDKVYAVKVLRPRRRGAVDRQALREARAVVEIDHPNLVAVHDVGVHGELAYIVMDWIDGADLGKWLSEVASDVTSHPRSADGAALSAEGMPTAPRARGDSRALRERLREFVSGASRRTTSGALWDFPYWVIVATTVARVARAVEKAHAKGVVHRDIAPKNVMVTSDGGTLLIDFGIAALVDSTDSTREVSGTPPYMAPEQFESSPRARQTPVDVYGLGATLYHLLTGHTPFAGARRDVAELVGREPPRPVRTIVPSVPADLAAICGAAMEKRPEDRPSAGELAEYLESFIEHRPIPLRSPGPWGRAVRWSRRHPVLAPLLVATCAVLVATTVAGVLWWNESRRLVVEADARRLADLYARLPALFTVEADARHVNPPELPVNDDVDRIIDELVRLEPDAPFLRWLRMNWNSQRGSLDEVEEDFQWLREEGHATLLIEVLAPRLLDPDRVARHQLAEPDWLPEPATALEHAIFAHLALRWRLSGDALEAIDAAREMSPDEWLYRDLSALIRILVQGPDAALEDAFAVQQYLKRETARTLHLRALALQATAPGQAIELWTRSDLLCPNQATVLHNIGDTIEKSLEFEDASRVPELAAFARETLERARRLRPTNWTVYLTLSRLDEREQDYEGALQTLAGGRRELEAAFGTADARPVRELDLERANVLAVWALSRLAKDDDAHARVILDEALTVLTSIGDEGLGRQTALELGSMRSQLGVEFAKSSPEVEVGHLLAILADQIEEGGGVLSPVIATNLGLVLVQLGPEHRSWARVMLLIGAADPATRSVAESALREL